MHRPAQEQSGVELTFVSLQGNFLHQAMLVGVAAPCPRAGWPALGMTRAGPLRRAPRARRRVAVDELRARVHLLPRPRWTPKNLFTHMPRRESWERVIGHAYWNVDLEE